jgi:hypothetical protein
VIDLKIVYKGKYFARRSSLAWRAEPVVSAVCEVLYPESVVDVGCAVGDLIKEFDKRKILCYGIEGTDNVVPYLLVDKEKVFIKDLRLPLNLGLNFHLAICLEVAEHIDEECADQFIDNLIGLSNRVLISTAPPGQGGHGHVNCQPYSYWIYKFANKGYINIQSVAGRIKSKLEPWKNKKGIKAYYNNLLYFERIKPF